MKTLAAALGFSCFISFTPVSLLAATPTAVMNCTNLEIYEAGTFKPASFSVTIVALSENPPKYKALIVSNGRSREERDVELRTSSAAEAGELKEMAETLIPGLKWAQVANVRAADVTSKSTREDSGGLLLIELFDKNQSVLGKIVEIAWGFGRCK